MVRPLRIEFSGALYHVTSRGDNRARIFADAADHRRWLDILGKTCDRYNFLIHAFVQMPNHYHLVVETVDAGLARGIQYLNGRYSQYFNQRHKRVGHVFQGRYHTVLCTKDSQLMELARYVVLNPVRAGLVSLPEHWEWSSHLAACGAVAEPDWLELNPTFSSFSADPEHAKAAYRQFVHSSLNAPNPLRLATNSLLLGDVQFDRNAVSACGSPAELRRDHRKLTALPLEEYFVRYADRNEAMSRAFRSTAYSMGEIAQFVGVSIRTVSRAVSDFESKSQTTRHPNSSRMA
jgi:REP element-mobilizing transposase RayT/AraC-like DNA-binding protein